MKLAQGVLKMLGMIQYDNYQFTGSESGAFPTRSRPQNVINNNTYVVPLYRNNNEKDMYVPELALNIYVNNVCGTIPGYSTDETGTEQYYECELPILYAWALVVAVINGGKILDPQNLSIDLTPLSVKITTGSSPLIPLVKYEQNDIDITPSHKMTYFQNTGSLTPGWVNFHDFTRSNAIRTLCIDSSGILFWLFTATTDFINGQVIGNWWTSRKAIATFSFNFSYTPVDSENETFKVDSNLASKLGQTGVYCTIPVVVTGVKDSSETSVFS
jgi:hypothetical protein